MRPSLNLASLRWRSIARCDKYSAGKGRKASTSRRHTGGVAVKLPHTLRVAARRSNNVFSRYKFPG
jgi:hypothetical protein